jgi:hypothetical protein
MVESAVRAASIGEVLVGLRYLESALRGFLYGVSHAVADSGLAAFTVGDEFLSNPLTNGDSLRQLIEKYNATVSGAGQSSLTVDPGLNDLWDDLEHGRIWGSDRELPLRLVKFSPPANGLVTCTYDQRVDNGWLDTQAGRIKDALDKVATAVQAVHPQRSAWRK